MGGIMYGSSLSLCYEFAPSVLQRLLEFPGLEGLDHDVGTACELPINIKLRDRRPVGVLLRLIARVNRTIFSDPWSETTPRTSRPEEKTRAQTRHERRAVQ